MRVKHIPKMNAPLLAFVVTQRVRVSKIYVPPQAYICCILFICCTSSVRPNDQNIFPTREWCNAIVNNPQLRIIARYHPHEQKIYFVFNSRVSDVYKAHAVATRRVCVCVASNWRLSNSTLNTARLRLSAPLRPFIY